MPSEDEPSIWRNGAFVRVWTAATASIFGSLITGLRVPIALAPAAALSAA